MRSTEGGRRTPRQRSGPPALGSNIYSKSPICVLHSLSPNGMYTSVGEWVARVRVVIGVFKPLPPTNASGTSHYIRQNSTHPFSTFGISTWASCTLRLRSTSQPPMAPLETMHSFPVRSLLLSRRPRRPHLPLVPPLVPHRKNSGLIHDGSRRVTAREGP